MTKNRLRELSNQTFDKIAQNLYELDLSSNAITVIQPGAFKELIVLHTLDLSRNQLTSIESHTFASLHCVKKLNLENQAGTGIVPVHPDWATALFFLKPKGLLMKGNPSQCTLKELAMDGSAHEREKELKDFVRVNLCARSENPSRPRPFIVPDCNNKCAPLYTSSDATTQEGCVLAPSTSTLTSATTVTSVLTNTTTATHTSATTTTVTTSTMTSTDPTSCKGHCGDSSFIVEKDGKMKTCSYNCQKLKNCADDFDWECRPSCRKAGGFYQRKFRDGAVKDIISDGIQLEGTKDCDTQRGLYDPTTTKKCYCQRACVVEGNCCQDFENVPR
jgi:hypothetical protein